VSRCSARALAVVLLLALCAGAWAAKPGDKARSLTAQALKLSDAGKLQPALQKLAAALKAVPGYTPAAQLAAVCNQRLGKGDAALGHYQTVQRASLRPLREGATEAQRAERAALVLCEATILQQTNRERMEQGLKPLLPDPRLALVARRHSDEMRDLGYFDHVSPTPGLASIRERFRQVFADCAAFSIGENIARRYAMGLYSLSTDSVSCTVQEWMGSPGHRANILRPEYTHLGVGLSVNANGDYWATQFFALFGPSR
jgi:uncharacterized protein YkwD